MLCDDEYWYAKPEILLSIVDAAEEEERKKSRELKTAHMISRMKRHQEYMKSKQYQLKKKLRSSKDGNIDDQKSIELSKLEALPEEILHLIFSYFDLATFVRSSEVSKKFYQVIQYEMHWKERCNIRWGTLTSSKLYRDLVDGQAIMWLVTFKKNYIREMIQTKREQQKKRISQLNHLECKYCHQDSAIIIDTQNTTSLFLVNNRTPRYTITIQCEKCTSKWVEGRGDE